MFTRENTKQIKGIAILLMMVHHLFTFPDKIPYGMSVATSFYISGKELLELIGGFGRICVPIYMFMGGYGLYKKAVTEGEQLVVHNHLAKDIVALYKAYWKVFFVFVPIGFLFFGNQIQYCANELVCFRFAQWSMGDFLRNLMGISSSFNSEWWFFWSYIFALFVGYVFIELFRKKRSLYTECAAVIVWTILLVNIFPILPFEEGLESLWSNIWYKNICLGNASSILVLVGILFAKYRIFESWKNSMNEKKRSEVFVLSLLFIALLVCVREFIVSTEFDIILVPLFVFACHILMEACGFLKRPLEVLGTHSTNMWLVHTFYCYYFYPFPKLIYGSNNAVIALVILLILSLGTSILLNLLWKRIEKGYRRLCK